DASTADAATDGAATLGKPTDPVSADAVGASAHADVSGSRTSAQMSDLRVLGFPGVALTSVLPIEELKTDPTVLRVEDATSRTDQKIAGGALVVAASSKLTGVSLVGGLVKIGSIVSTSTATDDGHGKRTSVADIEVQGVTVGGLPAQITEDGLVLSSPTNLGPAKQQILQGSNQLLQALGVRISLLDNVESTDDGTGLARAEAPGVLLEVNTDVSGVPPVFGPFGDIDLTGHYVGTIQLGMSGAAAGASNFDDEVIPPADVSFDVPSDAGFAPADTGVVDTGTAPVADVPAATDEPEGSAQPQQLIRRVVDRFGGRLGLVYLAFAFTVLGLCLVPRLTLPARFPGPRS
ncbi:MAG: choice-of-anchor P family protein, partial [Acidimicrobiales bacterium]